MTAVTPSPCVVCGGTQTTLFDPPHPTLDRGPDPNDDSYSIIVILPDVPLCHEHGRQVRDGGMRIGWCDHPDCREYGEAGELSACGARFDSLVAGTRTGSATKSH